MLYTSLISLLPLLATPAVALPHWYKAIAIRQMTDEAPAATQVDQAAVDAGGADANAETGAGAEGIDVGPCTDFSMSFRTGFAEATSPDEVRFGPSDATQFSQGAALNPTIVSNAMCDTFVNACAQSATTRDACKEVKATIDAQLEAGELARDQTYADAWLAGLESAFGITSTGRGTEAGAGAGTGVGAGAGADAAEAEDAGAEEEEGAVNVEVEPMEDPAEGEGEGEEADAEAPPSDAQAGGEGGPGAEVAVDEEAVEAPPIAEDPHATVGSEGEAGAGAGAAAPPPPPGCQIVEPLAPPHPAPAAAPAPAHNPEGQEPAIDADPAVGANLTASAVSGTDAINAPADTTVPAPTPMDHAMAIVEPSEAVTAGPEPEVSATAVAASMGESTAPVDPAASGDAGGVDIQPFTSALNGVAPTAVIQSTGQVDRPFSVDGDTFVNAPAALARSCDRQFNGCANVANAGQGEATVADCQAQRTACGEAIAGVVV